MAPSIIVGYSKDLSEFPECESREKNRVGYLVSPVFDVLCLTEWKLTGSPYKYCLTVSIVGGEDNGWLRELAFEHIDDGGTEEEAVTLVRGAVGHNGDDDEAEQVARFVYRDFMFRAQTGNDIGIQIKGAFVQPTKEKKAMARTVYGFLLNWHRHIISDDHQTVYGAKIWAKGMIEVGRVQVYDDSQKHFVDILTQGGVGIGGFKPWDALLLNEQQISHWNPNALSIDPADQILAIVSATDRFHQIGITTFDANIPLFRVVK
ncbi:hypothetical protein [Franconibacter daqui]|uniref:hypothetical protein n=1 Tax=Franconibacter daqui TaxID=2047724 RepID=UPI002DBF8295|nr:hypothetical protein [Franconibacter daqui]MEB5924634.1 hypothetical protein [Franconibacter daqui]